MSRTHLVLFLVSFVLMGCGMSSKEKQERAAVTCSIMVETQDAAIRVREMNDAREKIGGEPFLKGDSAIQEAFKWGLCVELVLNENYEETLQEKQRIADSKPSVKEEFYPNGKLKSRITHRSKNDGGGEYGPYEVYYESGQLSEKGNYKDGELHGLYETYSESGQLVSTDCYQNDVIMKFRFHCKK